MSHPLCASTNNIQQQVVYITSTHNQQQIIFNNQRFCLKQKNKNSTLWRCTKANCSASISVSLDNIIIRMNDNHNHFIESNEIKFLNLRHQLKNEAQQTSIPIDRIVESNYSKFILNQMNTDGRVKLPTIKTLKNTVSKQRRQVRPPLPKTLHDLPVQLPLTYTLTSQNDLFLLYDGLIGNKRGLLFASENDIRYLSKQNNWYCDGTFYTSPSIFYQIYSIHVFDDGFSTPCLFALLANKFQETYCDLFTIVNNKINELCPNNNVQTITIDFELAVKNAIVQVFPHVEVKGCLFHYGKSLFKKFVNLGLKNAFQNDEELRVWFRSFAAIALLPKNEIDETTRNFLSNKPNTYTNELNLFEIYHTNTYGVNSTFPPSMYNHFNNMNPRTINYLEGNHHRWKKRSLKAHDDIYRCIDMFKNEQLLFNDVRERSSAGEPPPKKTKKNRIAEESLFRLWDKYHKKKIDREAFLKAAGLRYFQHIQIE